jgi:uncharacterized membrane protein YhhN
MGATGGEWMGALLAELPPLPVALLVVAAVLAVSATILGDRGARGRAAPGVRIVKTSVPAVLLAAVIVAWAVSASGAGGAIGGSSVFGRGVARGAAPVLPALSQLLFVVGLALTVLADWWLAPVDNSKTFVPGLAAFLVGYLLYAGALWYAALAAGSGGAAGAAGAAGAGGVAPAPGGVALGAGGVAPGFAVASGGVAGLPLPIGLILAVLGVTGAMGLIQARTLTGVAPELRGAVAAYMVVATLLLAGGVLLFAREAGGAAAAVLPGVTPAGAATPAARLTFAATRTAPGAFGAAARRVVASLLLAGTVLIYLSDSLIAHNLFRRPLRREELWIMPTYYLGQGAVALALVVAV